MNDRATLTIASLLAIALMLFHWADDIVRGFAPGGVSGFGGVAILTTWLYGTTALRDRRSGHAIMLLGSIFGLGVLLLHMTGAGLVGGRIAHSDGMLFWVWTLIALGVTSALSMALAARGLWRFIAARRFLG